MMVQESMGVESLAMQWCSYESRVLPSFENFNSSSVGLAILVLLISSGMPDSSNTWRARQRAHQRLQSSVQLQSQLQSNPNQYNPMRIE